MLSREASAVVSYEELSQVGWEWGHRPNDVLNWLNFISHSWEFYTHKIVHVANGTHSDIDGIVQLN